MTATLDKQTLINIHQLSDMVDTLLDLLEDQEALPDTLLDALGISSDDFQCLNDISAACYEIVGDQVCRAA